MIPCVLLAGAPTRGSLCEAGDERWEALLPVAGEPMVAHVVRAILDSGQISRITVVGPEPVRSVFTDSRIRVVESGDSLMENAGRGLAAERGADHVLVATADIPLLPPEAVSDFIARCGNREADFYYTVVSERVVAQRFPEARRTYVRLREGRFTGGNIVLLRPAVFDKCRKVGEQFAANRKKPLKLARMIGAGFLLRYALGTLSLASAERKVTQLIGISGRVIETPYPEVAVDVDKLSDYELAKKVLEGSQ
ncbi:NTP transferase domain-containing protein [Desulforudis sp. 1088]|uniref:NTP transferase domain-containing protein n=1 Tax=unclassified Candidatus Desulforudis TaxID=2635950 RepID=UPI003BC340B7